MPHKYAFRKYICLPNARQVLSAEVTKIIIWCSEVPYILYFVDRASCNDSW